ncbi:1-acyl-sn-glycerol-3-phosphate acyltransferase [Leuconostoc gelidum subsp. gelidum]|uniref:lysophospholipid acyltransferase family protein n=1 Tax=Leuconostoc gelidum TaxID=1244 RepID=UPI001CC449EC|nr:1-acyl-sn-glycerol-3-phosphate acyltransferase [Leuconostoc gelidum]MBZ6013625.1 1-acyl-sn-glycerol-3-phosphate acyltransferase [Leuconostoc gelidum subsp. gelidum]
MFYRISTLWLKLLFLLLFGPIRIHGIQYIPKKNFILIADHQSWWDAIIYACWLSPKSTFFFMAKKELFEGFLLGRILRHLNAFPIDRNHPTLKSLQLPINELRNQDKSLIIFPTGSRFSNKMKPGYLMIARRSHTPVLPAVIEKKGWGKTVINLGKPYYIENNINRSSILKENKKAIEFLHQNGLIGDNLIP